MSLRRLSDTALSGAAAGATTGQVPTLGTSGRFAPAAGISDNPVFTTHNLTPPNSARARAALARCRAGTADFRLLVQGDSISNGTGATTPATDVWGRKVAATLAQRTGLTYRKGFIPANDTAQWTPGADWTVFASNIAPTLSGLFNGYRASVGTSTTLDFTPLDDSGVAIQTDSFVVYAFGSTGNGGNFQWSIDGGSFTTQTVSAVTGYTAYTLSAGTRGLHTLHIKAAATGNPPYILGAEAVDSGARGIRWLSLGVSGANTPTGIVTDGLLFLNAYAPDVHMPAWGINDYFNQVALATFQANAQSVMAVGASLTKKADTIWMSTLVQGTTQTIPQSSYFAALDAAADLAGVPVIHFDRIIPTYATANAAPLSIMNDTFHPNTVGHNMLGAAGGSVLSLF